MTSKAYHYTHPYLLAPPHRLTVTLVGCGGTGSRLLTNLGMVHTALMALGHPGIHVTAIDGDTVSQANQGRQMFSAADIGYYKAECLIQRMNRFNGTDWSSINRPLDTKKHAPGNIVISCVDNMEARKAIHQWKHDSQDDTDNFIYWIDTGNGKDYGQVILSTKQGVPNASPNHVANLPDAFMIMPELRNKKNSDAPSCSVAEALTKQDLFVNSMAAMQAGEILWKLFSQGRIDYQGVFFSTGNVETRKLKL